MDVKNFLKLSGKFDSWNLVGPMLNEDELPELGPLPTVFVDGGLNFKKFYKEMLKEVPQMSMGDGDSLAQEKVLDVSFSPEKDITDLSLALNIVPSDKDLFLYGFSGGRMDHYLANLGGIHEFLKNRNSKVILDNHVLFLSTGVHNFQFVGTFSLLAIESTEVKIRGEVKYPLLSGRKLMPLSGFGVSNEAFGDFEITSTGPILVFGITSHLK